MSIILILVFMTAILTGCKNTQAPSEKTEEKGDYSVTVIDGLKQEVKFTKKPMKIISVLPSSTEIIYALGEGDRIIGVSDFDNYPNEVTSKEKFGSMELNIEKIIAAKPDMLILSVYHAKTYATNLQQLHDVGIQVLTVEDATTFEGTYQAIKQMGEVLATEPQAEEIIAKMKKDVDDVRSSVKALNVTEKKEVWVEISPSPEIYTAGKGTFVDEMLTMLNADNVAKDIDGWSKMSEEQVVAANPDIIITTYGSYQTDATKQVLSRSGWSQINAIQNQMVFDLPNDPLSRPGPRIVEGLKDLFEAIYGEVAVEKAA